MKFERLSLVLTDRCNAACDFCGFSCTPKNNHVMDVQMMERIIREAKTMGIRAVGFSGGEPFLYPELLEKGSKIAKEEGMEVNIATNGFWGAWEDDKIDEILKRIRPNFIGISYDDFHRKFIPEDVFFKALSHCYALNIKTRVFVADLKDEHAAGRFLMSLDNRRFRVPMFIYPVYRCGRARHMPSEWFLTYKYEDVHITCLSEHAISVLYNGDIYPCCRHQVYESAMKLGNVSNMSLQEGINKSDVPKICDVLMHNDRFKYLVDKAKDIGIIVPEEAGCSCDYCRALFGTEENMQRMLPFVEELYGKMLVRSILNGVGES
ncbi:MAG: radical SAM protein [Lachnospiraceae bacterium]|nr:radical SAM protein [Lachnospiraceae bacterium]